MKLRDSFYACIKYKVGNGRHIYTWVDNWHHHGSLIRRYGERLIYDTVSTVESKLSQFIQGGRWSFPRPTSADLFRVVQELPDIDPVGDESVEWQWYQEVQSAKEFIRSHGERVTWWNTVWFKKHVPSGIHFMDGL